MVVHFVISVFKKVSFPLFWLLIRFSLPVFVNFASFTKGFSLSYQYVQVEHERFYIVITVRFFIPLGCCCCCYSLFVMVHYLVIFF